MIHIPGIVTIGELPSIQVAKEIKHELDLKQWPVIADITSMLRNLYPRFDLTSITPKQIIHIGGPLTSRYILNWMESHTSVDHCHLRIKNRPFNPFGAKQRIIHGLESLQRTEESSNLPILTIEPNSMSKFICDLTQLAIASKAAIFCGNSLSIRYFDEYYPQVQSFVPLYASRGASGIDGQIATIAGLATGLKSPVIAMIGDLTLLHDCNSLALLKQSEYPIILVVLNNNGGGIFERLPHLKRINDFDKYVKTPHNLNLERVVTGFNLTYDRQLPQKLTQTVVIERVEA